MDYHEKDALIEELGWLTLNRDQNFWGAFVMDVLFATLLLAVLLIYVYRIPTIICFPTGAQLEIFLQWIADQKDRGRLFCTVEHYEASLAILSSAIKCVHTFGVTGNMTTSSQKQLLACLYSSRAACCLKLRKLTNILKDCDAALMLDATNLEAIHCKASVLMMQHDYPAAQREAETGAKLAERYVGNEQWEERFRIMLQKICSQIPGRFRPPETSILVSNTTVTEHVPDVDSSIDDSYVDPLAPIHELKNAGNECYKNKDFLGALQQYQAALSLNVGPLQPGSTSYAEQISILYSNKAACLIKLGEKQMALRESDMAIVFNENNIKAYYRKACMLKDMNDSGALKAAHRGRECAQKIQDSTATFDFDKLIKQIHDCQTSERQTRANTSPNVEAPITRHPPVVNQYYCHYCSTNCNSQTQLDHHCTTDKHMFNVNSDSEHPWNFRQPPWGVACSDFELCKKHLMNECEFSPWPEHINRCQGAHSQDELDEWKKHWESRQLKRKLTKQQHVYSYTKELREEYEAALSGINVIADETDGLTIMCSKELEIFDHDKQATHNWTFNVVTADAFCLRNVSLLYDRDRLHFSIKAKRKKKKVPTATLR